MNALQATFSLVVLIVDRGKGDKLCSVLASGGVKLNVILPARGTAAQKLLSCMGLGETKKEVVLVGVPAQYAQETIQKATEKLQLKRPGKGIAFAIPINGVADAATQKSLTGRMPKKEETAMGATTHHLILSIMNHGYADDVMDTARDAGAPGGTIIRGHGTAESEQIQKFLGITIQPEKDILMILAPEGDCPAIMDAIVKKHGIPQAAAALAFSVPIAYTAGLSIPTAQS